MAARFPVVNAVINRVLAFVLDEFDHRLESGAKDFHLDRLVRGQGRLSSLQQRECWLVQGARVQDKNGCRQGEALEQMRDHHILCPKARGLFDGGMLLDRLRQSGAREPQE